MLTRLRIALRALLRRDAAESDLDDELRFHLEEQVKLYVAQGMSHAEATRRARIAFGSVDAHKESYRDGRGTRGFDDVVADLRHATRSLLRDRALTVAGVLTLALGIGATTAVFSAVNAVMLRELPFREPSRLVQLWEENPDRGWYENVVAPANFIDWREQADAFADMAAYTDYATTSTLIGRGEPRLLNEAYITANFLSVLGITPRLGGGFGPGVDFENGERPVLISARLWREQFASDPNVVGQSIDFGGTRPWQVVGVMPDDFAFPSAGTDLWKPMLWSEQYRNSISFRRAHWLRVVGRLKPGVSVAAATASLQGVAKRLEAQYPATNTRMGAGVTPLRDWVVGNTRRPLIVLLASAAVLLLIACANVGNLLLVHAVSRSRDVALRFALGASRARVARQAITESLVLSTAGGVAGFALGWAGARALLALQPEGMLPVADIPLDYRVLLFAALLTTVSGLVFGLAPALIATRQAPADALNAGGRTFTSGKVRRWGRHLVAAEVALAVMLTIGAGLLLRSYDNISRVEPGFDGRGVLTAGITIPASRYDSASKVIAFFDDVIARLQQHPDVEHAAFTRELPATQTSWTANLAVDGRPPMAQSQDIVYRETMGDYFRTMRVPLKAGRPFESTDNLASPPVAIINEVLRQKYFPNEDPIGRRIAPDRVPDSTTTWRTIVGVVGAEHQGSLVTPPRAEVYLPGTQSWTRRLNVVVRAKEGRDPVLLVAPLRRVVRDVDSLLALNRIRTMDEVRGASMARERFTSVLVLVFAVTGVVLALVGVFGVLAQLVQSRWRELGIRLALGAQRSQVRWLVARNGATLLATGIVAGVLVAFYATRVLANLLYEVKPTDAPTYVAVAVLIGAVGMLAAWIPAWRASAANPVATLKSD